MADEPNKPRKVKDLKARLGKTIAPSTVRSGPDPAAPPGAVTPPPGAPGGGIAPPPFLQKQKAKKSDPFAQPAVSAEAAAQREVRIVFDEKPVDDAEVGRKQSLRVYLMIGSGVLVGLLIGFAIMSMFSGRRDYNAAVRDGKAVYDAVREASTTIDDTRSKIDALVSAASGGPGRSPRVDYATIEALQSIAKPFTANTFTRKRYSNFAAGTVDTLFEYYNKVNQLWDRLASLAARTLPPARRRELDQAAEAAGSMASSQFGCVPSIDENRYVCNLVFLEIPEQPSGDNKVNVRAGRARGQTAEKTIFTGQRLDQNTSDFVILVHTANSIGVLGQPASAFADYQRDIVALKQLADETLEIQGRLEQQLGEIASLEEIFSL